MKRRHFLQAAAAAPLAASLPRAAFAQQLPFNLQQATTWREFEIVTRIDVARPAGITKAWIPLPSVDGEYQKTSANTWSGNASTAKVVSDGKYGAQMVYAEWAAGESAPFMEVTSRFQTRDRATDFSKGPNAALKLDADERRFYTEATTLLPTDGIVRTTAQDIVKGRKSELDKARALYEWVVENTARDPKTRGCGVGDIKSMLETKTLSGKCADLNALYVGLARSVGLPAREVYGLRVVKSAFGYRSLGAGSDNVTRAQHCRAEVFVAGYGWVPVDPADVRKVVLEEKPQPTNLADPVVPPVRKALFGGWEMNWLAYNEAHDVKLPGSKSAPVGFLMYPQLETADGLRDSLDPDNFKYKITARQV
jgi:transglutaminase-like putative cysteine protease